MKNILLTNMSTLPQNPHQSDYFGEFVNEQGEVETRYCQGISQLEAGTKYFLSKVDIHKIVVIGTEATEKRTHKREGKDVVVALPADEAGMQVEGAISADEFYVERILEFLQKDEGDFDSETLAGRIPMIALKRNRKQLTKEHFEIIKDVAKPHETAAFEVDNVQGIVNTILDSAKGEEKINLYIDMQGGIRTSGFVRNAVLSIVGNERDSRVEIQEIIATEYNHDQKVSKIVDETKRYKIMDLAAAMNAFVRYGKVDLLKKYCEERKVYPVKYDPNTPNEDRKPLGNLLWLMEKVDDSISLCNVKGLDEAIEGMKSLLSQKNGMMSYKHEYDDDRVFVKSVFDILIDGIERDYGKVLTATGDECVLEKISWCTRKGFLQQALTLVEDQMPKVFFKKEVDAQDDKYVLKYEEKTAQNLKEFGEKIGHTYYEEENNLFYSLEGAYRSGWNYSVYKKLIDCLDNQTSAQNFSSQINGNLNILDEITYILDQNGIQIGFDNSGNQIMTTMLDETELVKLVVELNRLSEMNGIDKDDFVDTYLEFQIANNEKEFNKIHKDAASIYYKLKREGYCFNTKPLLTLTHVISDNSVARKFKHTKSSPHLTRFIYIRMNADTLARRQRLDSLLRLHRALKLERNCTNHASDKGMRLPASVVKRALEIYVEEANYFVN